MAKDADWQALLVDGYEPVRRVQRVFRRVPSAPRCKLCQNPFGGIGGRVFALAGFRPSRKNPNLCAKCCESLPPGGLELDIAVVFADVRGSTALGEELGPTAFADRLNHFYGVATEVLVQRDAIIDKLIGDEVMALFIPGFAGASYRERAVEAAIALSRADTKVPLGVAVNAGVAFVGNVGTGYVVDFTALGDAVNVASRLQAYTQPGEVVLEAALHQPVAARHPPVRSERVDVRGRDEPVDIVVVRP